MWFCEAKKAKINLFRFLVLFRETGVPSASETSGGDAQIRWAKETFICELLKQYFMLVLLNILGNLCSCFKKYSFFFYLNNHLNTSPFKIETKKYPLNLTFL